MTLLEWLKKHIADAEAPDGWPRSFPVGSTGRVPNNDNTPIMIRLGTLKKIVKRLEEK